MTSSLLTLIWWHATKDKLLIDKNLHPFFIKGVMLNLISIPIVFTVSILYHLLTWILLKFFGW